MYSSLPRRAEASLDTFHPVSSSRQAHERAWSPVFTQPGTDRVGDDDDGTHSNTFDRTLAAFGQGERWAEKGSLK